MATQDNQTESKKRHDKAIELLQKLNFFMADKKLCTNVNKLIQTLMIFIQSKSYVENSSLFLDFSISKDKKFGKDILEMITEIGAKYEIPNNSNESHLVMSDNAVIAISFQQFYRKYSNCIVASGEWTKIIF